MAPGSQLCNEIRSQSQSLCKSPDYYWDSKSLEGFSDGSVGKESAWSLDVQSQKKKPTLKMTTRPSDFSFAVIFLKGNTLLWNWRLFLHFDLFSSVRMGTEVEGSGLWSPPSLSSFNICLERETEATFQTCRCMVSFEEIFLLHPLLPPHSLHTHLTPQCPHFRL